MFDKNLCFFCQEAKASKLHEVCSQNVNLKLRNAVERIGNDELKIRLNTAAVDARAADIKYHLPCWVKWVCRFGGKASNGDEEFDVKQLAVEFELVKIVDTLTQEGDVLTMNQLLETYYDLLNESGKVEQRSEKRIKAWLKMLISTRISNIE